MRLCSVTRVLGACACELNGKQSMLSSKTAGSMQALYVEGHGKKDMQMDRKNSGCMRNQKGYTAEEWDGLIKEHTLTALYCTTNKCRPRIPLGTGQPSGGQASLPAIWLIQWMDE